MGRFRMAWRALRAAPLTRAAAVTLIAVGVGANSAVFAVTLRVVPAGSLAAVALVVALVGVFALLGRVAAEGRREFAIRLALGASRGRVVSMMLRRAASMTGLAIAMGLAGTTLVAGGLRGLLYGVGPQDPLTLAAVVSFVCVVAVGAALLPARQASRADPQELLRSE